MKVYYSLGHVNLSTYLDHIKTFSQNDTSYHTTGTTDILSGIDEAPREEESKGEVSVIHRAESEGRIMFGT